MGRSWNHRGFLLSAVVSQLGISELEMGGGLHPGLVDNWRVHRLGLVSA